ncbi:MAG: glutamate 5-kinase, partial [Opitutaceae bacterium]|nr:glutamate 5-kinase [Opitutaceae bacterium]
SGTLLVNTHAVPVLRDQGRSLLAVGVTGAKGQFQPGDIVNIAAPDGAVFARGKTAFGSSDIPRLAEKHGEEMRALFPNRKRHEVVHRNDLVLL